MGKIVQKQRRGKSTVYHARTHNRKGAAQFRSLDFIERNGFIQGVVKEIIHDPGRGAPVARIEFRNRHVLKKDKELFVAPEGMFSGQKIQCGKLATMKTGNVTELGSMLEGSTILNIESHVGAKTGFGRASGCACTILGHNREGKTTRVRLPSGQKKTLSSSCRAMYGIAAGGGRIDKPMLKAGNSFFKFQAKRKCWPVVRGVARNPVEHPHGGGNHQHVGHPTTVYKKCCAGQRVGLVGARRTGTVRGTPKLRDRS